jgi:hypothetical protein
MQFFFSLNSARLSFGARASEHTRETQLALLAGASFLIYALAFVLPYNLFTFWNQPQLTIAKIAHGDWRAGASYVVAFVALFAAYLFTARIVRQNQNQSMWRIAIIGMLAFNVVMLFLYPVDSADIFDNIIRGRMTALYGANPFYDTPFQFASDPFHGYNAWEFYPSAYGALWETLAATTARVAGDSIIANVLAFKLISTIAYVGTAIAIALTLRRIAPAHALLGFTLVAWNPLAIYVTVGTGHNDAVMIFFVALGFLFLARKNFALAALAQMLGALVKFIPILLVPLMLLAGFNHQRDWKSRARYTVITIIACAAIAILAYAPFFRGGDILGLKWRSNNLTTSLPALAQVTLLHSMDKDIANEFVSRAALILLSIWIARELWLNRRSQAVAAFVRASLSILIFYLLVACLWVQAWYALWLVPLAALVPDDTLAHGSLVIAFSFAMKMPIFDFAMGVTPDYLTREMREWEITPSTLGLPWIYFVGMWLKRKVRLK